MATLPRTQNLQGTLSSGTTTLYTAPYRYQASVSLRFNNPSAYDIEITINRANPVSSIVAYSITLSAGDTVMDSGYDFNQGDSIQVTTSVSGTVYMISIYDQIPYPNPDI
jgi:hypothetical protein